MLVNIFLIKISSIQWMTFFCNYATLNLKMNCQDSGIKIVACLGAFLFLKGKNYLLFENGFLGVGFSVGSFLSVVLLTLL